jgi:radical SAM superfamily enzyme YgiQ (UPF0313 family)
MGTGEDSKISKDNPPLKMALVSVHPGAGPDAVPLGAACVAAALKAAFPGKGGRGAVSVVLVESLVSDGLEVLLQKIRAAGARALGFSLYCWNRELVLETARRLRSEGPELFLFCGGPEATALPEGLSRSRGGPFDGVISGEGEDRAVRLIGERFFQKPFPGKGNPAAPSPDKTPPSRASFPWPSPWLDGTLKPHDREGVLWELARGCPYRCYYCYESKIFIEPEGFAEPSRFDEPGRAGKGRIRYIPDERLREELRLFVEKGVPYVFVLDPTFNADSRRALGILDMIGRAAGQGRKGREIHWHFEVRGELLTREQARAFARLGASLQVGLQTADSRVAALAGRSFNRRSFGSRINLLNEEGVYFGLDLIYGLPGDTLGGYRRSLDFALSLYPNNLDLFRLSVLPGTVFAEKAAELALRADPGPPYLVRETPGFPAADLDRAERLSVAADIFYNRGRAVAWFNQVLRPLRIKPSAFLEGFAAFRESSEGRCLSAYSGDGREGAAASLAIEKAQLAYLETRYRRMGKEALVPAVRDLVRFHGAWGRALAEGCAADIPLSYHPDGILGPAALDLEAFVASVKTRPVLVRVKPGKNGPEVSAAP